MVQAMTPETDAWQIEVDKANEHRWNAIISGFADANLFQSWAFGAATTGAENLSHVVVGKGSFVAAAAQVRIMRVPFFGRGVAYVGSGPLWRPKGRAGDPRALRQMIQAIKSEYVLGRRLYVRIKPNEFVGLDRAMEEALEAEGFGLRPASRDDSRTIILGLEPSLDELRKNFKKRWRYDLRRAERAESEVVWGTGEELYDAFCALFREMHARKMFAGGTNVDRWREVQPRLPQEQKVRILLCKSNSAPVAALGWAAVGDSAYLVLFATSPAARESRAGYLLLWRVIQMAKEMGMKRLDLAGVNRERNPGVYHFKSGIGGVEVRMLGVYDTCRRPLLAAAVRGGEAILSMKVRAQRGLLRAAKTLRKR